MAPSRRMHRSPRFVMNSGTISCLLGYVFLTCNSLIGENSAFLKSSLKSWSISCTSRITLNDGYLRRHNSLYINLTSSSKDCPRGFKSALNSDTEWGWQGRRDRWWRGIAPNNLRRSRGYRGEWSWLSLRRSRHRGGRRECGRLRGLGW